jgi:hypothetical protein
MVKDKATEMTGGITDNVQTDEPAKDSVKSREVNEP